MKKKTNITLRDLVFNYDENCTALRELAETIEKEQRDLTDAERSQRDALMRSNEILRMKIAAIGAATADAPNASADASRLIRDNMAAGRQTKIILTRDIMTVADLADGAVVPVKVQDFLKPLTEGLILDKVGLPMPTGLAGDYVWPTYEAVEATIAGEGVALTDTKINFGKLTATPQRIGIAIPVTRQTLIQSDGIVDTIVRELMPLSIAMLLNKILFSTAKVSGATTLVGPFVGIAAADQVKLSAEPTFKEYNSMKAKVLSSGVDGEHLCWVMTKAQKAIAEATPKDAGSGIMVCENDRIAGLPVFTTNYIGEGNVGLGDWRYQPMGLFGDMSFIIDPYSQARKDAVDFVLNANYGTTTLRPKAFVLGKITAA